MNYWEIKDASTVAAKYAIVNPMEDKVRDFLNKKRVDKVGGNKTQSSIVYFSMTEILSYLGYEKESRNSNFIRELSELLRSAGCTKPEKSTRHPETGMVGKWYSYEHME